MKRNLGQSPSMGEGSARGQAVQGSAAAAPLARFDPGSPLDD